MIAMKRNGGATVVRGKEQHETVKRESEQAAGAQYPIDASQEPADARTMGRKERDDGSYLVG